MKVQNGGILLRQGYEGQVLVIKKGALAPQSCALRLLEEPVIMAESKSNVSYEYLILTCYHLL
jgi:hypothetical protein